MQQEICMSAQEEVHLFSNLASYWKTCGHPQQYWRALAWVCSAMLLLLLRWGIHASQIFPPNASAGVPCRVA
jgi:hypothetical protein